MLILHANWMDGALRMWGESLDSYLAQQAQAEEWAQSQRHRAVNAEGALDQAVMAHPFAASHAEVVAALSQAGVWPGSDAQDATVLRLRLPRDVAGPWPSDRLARVAGAVDLPIDPWLGEFEIQSVRLPNDAALQTLLRLEDHKSGVALDMSHSVRFWIAVARFVVELLADQRFIPTLIQRSEGGITAAWQPWLRDDDVRDRVGALMAAMPPVVRAVVNGYGEQPWPILDEAIRTLSDAAVRQALISENFIDSIQDRDPALDPHVAWLAGLLDRPNEVTSPSSIDMSLLRDAGHWVSRLEQTGQGQLFHLCLRLNEPARPPRAAGPDEPAIAAPNDSPWILSLHLQSAQDPDDIIDATDIWSHAPLGPRGDARIDQPQELLLSELGRASRLYSKIESALSETSPSGIQLTTDEAYDFLHNVRPVLEESGISVIAPAWWNQPVGRLAARLHVEASPGSASAGDGTSPSAPVLGLNSIVQYRWQVAIGDQPITMDEFRQLSAHHAPLVEVRGRWIEISPDQLSEARRFLDNSPSGEMTLLEAIHLAHGLEELRMGLPVLGMDASGWIADVLGASGGDERMPHIDQPAGFVGTLRPYQKTGLSWLAFLDRFGLGACLADDMGLGKTIQLIAMLLHERETAKADQRIAPTLLIVPTSVASNWVRELSRFAPSLCAHMHHGPDRPLGDRFVDMVNTKDLVITTYPLISRDQETLKRVSWHRVALDEAQYIKNPPTKQTTAIRSLRSPRRLALTGTPVENRLSELWSIMEFCNPGYLGSAGEFRRRFAVPVERHRDQRQAERLRHMVRPFVLRRVKTDPTVIDDLPECLETKEFATLTPEQAMLYQQVVNGMLGEVDRAQGMQRRGLVLAALMKLKQICNHPETGVKSQAASVLDDEPRAAETANIWHLTAAANGASLSMRSGKAKRLMTMLEEVLATGEKALVFTQFRQMGHLITAMIQSDLDREALFLHGGTPASKRQHLIDRFQSPDGGAPVFVLSLKAGGLGLNLTAANHVFHYDRWWNPAVENQATDRAFRIGQTRTVHVHKFVCVGTLEERIDQMIEQKTELAQNIIGAGEQWLTELSTGQLHDLLALRPIATETDT